MLYYLCVSKGVKMSVINVEKIENYRKMLGLTKTQFCKQCKIGMSVYNKIQSNKLNFDIHALFRISVFMNVDLCQLFYK